MNAPQPNWPTTLPLSKITKGINPRRYFDRQKHEELKTGFLLRGILQPILVRPEPDGGPTFQLVAGERRYRAAVDVFGPDGEVPVFVREMTDDEAFEAAVDENDNRDDASETEQADAAVRVLAASGNDRVEAARRLGWSRAKLERRLALAALPDVVKFALDERRIKVGHAELLAAVPADKQEKALETILASALDVNKTRDLLARVTQDLGRASFDKSECISCPFNSGTQRALFETHIEEGYCTNSACFELKTEAVEKARAEEQERAAAAKAVDNLRDDEEDNEVDQDPAVTKAGSPPPSDAPPTAANAASAGALPAVSTAASSGTSSSKTYKAAVTVKSLSARTSEFREAMWRTALARALASNPAQAQLTILVAAMSGTLSQIKPETLTSRSGLLIDEAFPGLDYKGQIAAIRALPASQAANILSVIGAAYAKDVLDFRHVADLARVFEIDLRSIWQVDQPFLERYTREELKFIAQDCGLVAHMAEKAFAKLLGSKKPDLIAGMLNRPGFDWAGRLPSCMTLDGTYGPPPPRAAENTDIPNQQVAA